MNETTRQNVEVFNAPLPAAPNGSGDLMTVISRAASDPNCDVSKMRELLALHKEMKAQDASDAYAAALSLAQADMGTVFKDKDNSHTKSRYASYEAVDKVARPIYTRHGFAPSFTTDGVSDTHLMVVCDLSHKGGHLRRYNLPIPLSTKGPKGNDLMTPTHASMSAFSYGKRGLLVGIYNIPISDASDDDGNGAGGNEFLTAAQIDTLQTMIARGWPDDPGYVEKFCGYLSKLAKAEIVALNQLPGKYFEDAKIALNSAERKKAGK